MAAQIKLETSDGIIFSVDSQVAKCSETIKTMLEDGLIVDDEEEDVPIPLANLNANVLRKVLDWAEHHVDDPPQPEYDFEDARRRTDDISVWDQEYMLVDQAMLVEIMMAANYLDIKGLIKLSCKTLANLIKGKTSSQIRATFNIENDFAPGEEDKINTRNKFCEERE